MTTSPTGRPGALRAAESLLDLVGETPLRQLRRFAPEGAAGIRAQLGRTPDAIVLAAGTGGTFSGVARYFRDM